MTTTTQAQGLPPQVAKFITVVSGIPGISEATLEKTYLPDVAVSDLSLPGAFADLPIAALRRTNGALKDELLFSVDFSIDRNEKGLKALEFLSWWVRDQSRGGENIQIRSIGLPPIAGKQVQLGHTLRFTIDWFYVNPSQEISQALLEVEKKASDLQQALALYKSAF